MKKFQWKNALFSYYKKILQLKRYKIALTTFWKKFWWITPVFLIWFSSNFDFKNIWEGNCLRKCSVLAWIRTRIEQKCWIRIRIKSIRIHNPDSDWLIFFTIHAFRFTTVPVSYYIRFQSLNDVRSRWKIWPWRNMCNKINPYRYNALFDVLLLVPTLRWGMEFHEYEKVGQTALAARHVEHTRFRAADTTSQTRTSGRMTS
jgi:hypothetical protein